MKSMIWNLLTKEQICCIMFLQRKQEKNIQYEIVISDFFEYSIGRESKDELRGVIFFRDNSLIKAKKDTNKEIDKIYYNLDCFLYKFFALNFTLDEQYVLELCKAIIKSSKQNSWSCTTRPDLLENEELVKQMTKVIKQLPPESVLFSGGVDSSAILNTAFKYNPSVLGITVGVKRNLRCQV